MAGRLVRTKAKIANRMARIKKTAAKIRAKVKKAPGAYRKALKYGTSRAGARATGAKIKEAWGAHKAGRAKAKRVVRRAARGAWEGIKKTGPKYGKRASLGSRLKTTLKYQGRAAKRVGKIAGSAAYHGVGKYSVAMNPVAGMYGYREGVKMANSKHGWRRPKKRLTRRG